MVTKNKIAIIIIAILFLILFIFGLIKIPCPIHEFTGLYCPGCGVGRMIISIAHLDFYQAFRYNPMVFILLPFIIYIVLITGYNWLFNKEIKIKKKLNIILYVCIGLLIVFAILRNIPLFSYLQPTKIS